MHQYSDCHMRLIFCFSMNSLNCIIACCHITYYLLQGCIFNIPILGLLIFTVIISHCLSINFASASKGALFHQIMKIPDREHRNGTILFLRLF